MADFLKGLSFLILPLGLGSKRKEFFVRKIEEFGGRISDLKPSHVIVEESVSANVEGCISCLRSRGVTLEEGGIVVVGTKWLSSCISEKRLVDSKPYELLWSTKYAAPVSKKVDVAGDERSPAKKRMVEPGDRSRSPTPKPDDVSDSKKLIVGELKKLADAYAARNDTWRAYSYENAVSAILRYDKDIKSFQEARQIPGIGEKMALKIMEILESGMLVRVEEVVDEKTQILQIFCGIWGVGPTTAENWFRQGYRSLKDLKESGKLSKQQEIGLKFYDDFSKRMTREEVERIGAVVEKALGVVGRGRCRMEIVGSYRRGRETCGDVDIMIVNGGPRKAGDILLELTDELRNYLTDDLVALDGDSDGHRKYLGVFKFPESDEPHRRIDLFVVPEWQYAAALMHYTGSAMYNRFLRQYAAKKGMTLNERGLYAGVVRKGSVITNEGELVLTVTEKDIFDKLGLEYKSPSERDQ